MSFSGTKGYLTKPKPGVMLDPLHPLSKGLVGYWLFNEGVGSLANDISGYGNHGMLMNMPPNTQGSGWGGSQFGSGLWYNGTNDHLKINDNDRLDVTTAYTFMAWIYPKSYGSHANGLGRILCRAHHDFDTLVFALNKDNAALGNENMYFTINNNAAVDGWSTSNDYSISLNNWQHVVVTWDGAILTFYVNGVQAGTDTVGNGGSSTDDLYIGSTFIPALFFNGIIDIVSIYNCALSATEIKQLYHNPYCNLLQVPIRRYSVITPPVGAIINQFQRANLGADLYNGVFA